MPPAELASSQPAVLHRWLSIVGIGEDGIEGLSAAGRELIQSAAVVFGGARHPRAGGALDSRQSSTLGGTFRPNGG